MRRLALPIVYERIQLAAGGDARHEVLVLDTGRIVLKAHPDVKDIPAAAEALALAESLSGSKSDCACVRAALERIKLAQRASERVKKAPYPPFLERVRARTLEAMRAVCRKSDAWLQVQDVTLSADTAGMTVVYEGDAHNGTRVFGERALKPTVTVTVPVAWLVRVWARGLAICDAASTLTSSRSLLVLDAAPTRMRCPFPVYRVLVSVPVPRMKAGAPGDAPTPMLMALDREGTGIAQPHINALRNVMRRRGM